MLVIVSYCPEEYPSTAAAIETIIEKTVIDSSTKNVVMVEIPEGTDEDLLVLQKKGWEVAEVPF
jgi:hypothetical protein